ncbi:MAG: cation transporter [Verrucomicrobia bacterium]|nr:cation transporter [Verrucomicrobiota bacterium]
MSHEHSHRALHRSLWIAFAFMLIEILGAYFANSLALLSDAMHLFTDVGALSLGLLVSHMARWPSTPTMSFGYHRAEVIGALASSISLWALSGVLIYESIHRLFLPETVEGPIVLVVAVVGLIANVIMMRLLHSHQSHNLNLKAAYLHVLGDLLGSVGVIISGLLIWLTGWNPFDSIVTILFTLSILYSSGKVIRESLTILMQRAPGHINPLDVFETLKKIPGVREVHDLHIWSVSSRKVALSVHLIADPSSDVLGPAHKILEKTHGIRHMTIQVESPSTKYCSDFKNKINW